jgi:hypothetical protein
METKVNLAEKLALLDAPFQPGIVGTLNDYKLAVVKVHGEFARGASSTARAPARRRRCC